jgi:MFS family permease
MPDGRFGLDEIVLAAFDLVTPWMLLGFTFALGVGAALVMPAWAAIVQDLVAADALPSAIALNSIAINVSRAIGPAIASVLVAVEGPWLVSGLNALSYIGIIAVLLRWRRAHRHPGCAHHRGARHGDRNRFDMAG